MNKYVILSQVEGLYLFSHHKTCWCGCASKLQQKEFNRSTSVLLVILLSCLKLHGGSDKCVLSAVFGTDVPHSCFSVYLVCFGTQEGTYISAVSICSTALTHRMTTKGLSLQFGCSTRVPLTFLTADILTWILEAHLGGVICDSLSPFSCLRPRNILKDVSVCKTHLAHWKSREAWRRSYELDLRRWIHCWSFNDIQEVWGERGTLIPHSNFS